MGDQQFVPPHDIFGPLAVGISAKMVALVILLLAMVAALFWYKKRFPKRAASPSIHAAEPLQDEIIWQRFGALAPKENFSSVERQSFYGGLTEVMRLALAMRLGSDVRAATTHELEKLLTLRSPLSMDDTKRLARFLTSADAIKFARRDATHADDVAWHGDVRRWLSKLLARPGESA